MSLTQKRSFDKDGDALSLGPKRPIAVKSIPLVDHFKNFLRSIKDLENSFMNLDSFLFAVILNLLFSAILLFLYDI
jgi:hypothetical protein